MGMPSHIINREDLEQIIIQALNSNSLKVNLTGLKLPETVISGNTEGIETGMKSILDVLNTQSQNAQDLFMSVSNLLANTTIVEDLYIDRLYDLSLLVSRLIAEELEINELLNKIKDYLSLKGIDKSVSIRKDIPSVNGTYYLNCKVSEESNITKITSFQNQYDFSDCWDLRVNGVTVFENVFSKGIEQRKYFSSPLKVIPTDRVEFLFYNNSGKQKTIYYDIDFLTIS
ncbi:hypothetical protein AR9_g056 [Bacillus phage AR9]|uniref:Uncharacterized protein n=2 Tax=Bacillus phage PBS1 TaxID=10683 RepID=A0A172JHW3_BPPB1|nr:hypothetical protein BI022_gp056 [Bacillus phage AR9]YP_009664447.1 hypothetical protein FK780_gp201 [Bacillus phage PBS1]AMS01141.1 hypothetical protein AR9_g056 [Bacillus phage AR9]ASU00068.1 hypothetical protein PBI_PBS1_246 [Bacillus phage PBS1]BDE75422.1 hypothetical protein [Bacillus phage PBS1]